MRKKDSSLKFGKALYKLAAKKSISAEIFHQMEDLLPLFEQKDFLDMLNQLSFLEIEQLKKTLSAVFGKNISDPLQNLLILLIKHREVKSFLRIYEVYKKQYFEAENIADLSVCSARPLTESEQKELVEKLKAGKLKKVSVKFSHNPELIGGIQIYENGKLTDFTAKNYLETLKEKLLQSNQFNL